jgi:hypothetical protein
LSLPALLTSSAAQAQTKPRVQVPAERRSESQALVQQLLKQGKIMRSSDAKRGMKGYALSVMQGTTIEKFPIEVIGNLEKVMGGGDLVLIRVTGGTVVKRESGIVAGMSGSPVYINGKLLGAIAIGFGFPKEPIGGVTPITQMIETSLPDPSRARVVAPSGASRPAAAAEKTSTQKPAQQTTAQRLSALRAMSTQVAVYRPTTPLRVAGRDIARVVVTRDKKRLALAEGPHGTTMTMRPCSLLLQISGMSAASLPRMRQMLEPYGIEPVMGGGTLGGSMGARNVQVMGPSSRKTGVNPPFTPGGAIGVQMASGDIDMTGVGTITYRLGNRVLAFGHPMFGIGAVSLPMTTSFVHDIFPSYNVSFKLASPVKVVGALQQDNSFAVGGTVGMKAEMVPMRVFLHNPNRQIRKNYRVQLMKDPLFTPMLAINVAFETLSGTLGMESDKMLRLGMRMNIQGQKPIVRYNYVYAQDEVFMPALNQLFEPIILTQMNTFKRAPIQSIDFSVTVEPTRKTARIRKIFADRNRVKAGEDFRVSVVLEPTTAPDKPITRTFTFSVPEDAPTGTVRVAAGPADDYWTLQTRVGEAPPRPTNLQELLAAYEKIGASDELLVSASTPRTFLMVDRNRVPNPPSSWQKLLRNTSSTAVSAYNEVQSRREKSEFSLSGSQFLVMAVESRKHSDKIGPDSPTGNTTSPSDSIVPMPETSSSTASSEASIESEVSEVWSRNPIVSSMQDYSTLTRALSGDRSALSSLYGGGSSGVTNPSNMSSALSGSLPLGAQANAWRSQMLRAQSRVQADRSMSSASGAFKAQTPGTTVRPVTPGVVTPTPVPTATPTPTPTPTPSSDGSKGLGRAAQRWIQSSQVEFARGDFQGAQVTNTGIVQLAPTGKLLATTTEPFAWSIAADGRGNTYLGTGNEARIIKIDANGTTSTLYDGQEVAVTALTTDAAGNLYAGVSPGGRILRFSLSGERGVIFNTGQTFVWALEFDAQGRLLIATGGERGALYRINIPTEASSITERSSTPSSAQPLTRVVERHVRAISLRGSDIFVGTGDDAVLYQVDGTSGAATALFQVAQQQSTTTSAQSSDSTNNSEYSVPFMMGGGGSGVMYLLMASEMPNIGARPLTPGRNLGAEILAVSAAPDGVYFGTSINGTIYRWSAERGVTPIYTAAQEQSIYSLRRGGDGSLYAATGDKGMVYQIKPGANPKETRAARLIEATQLQALAIGTSPTGDLVVGTGNNAAAYRIPLSQNGGGLFMSNVFDAKNIVRWGALRMTGNGVAVETRSGNTLEPDATWSSWQPAATNDLGELRVASPPARYLQYRARLSGGALASSNNAAQLSRIEVLFRA